jgi:hypothetical protein
MKHSFRALSLLPCMALLLAIAPTAHAQISSATVYEGIPDPGNAGDSTNWASTLPNATFTIGSLGVDFASSSDVGVAAFLNNPTFLTTANGFLPNYNFSSTGIELVLSGQAYLTAGNNSFVVGHDDGVVLTFTTLPGGFGNGVDDPGPTGFTNTPFNFNNPDAAGLYSFTLDYAECCGPPADLLFTVNGAPLSSGSAPEPSSLTLMGTGVLAFAGMIRRRFVA